MKISSATPRMINFQCAVSTEMQQAKISNLGTPAGFAVLLGLSDLTGEFQKSAVALSKHLEWRLLGYVGSLESLLGEANRIRERVIGASSFGRRGPVNGEPLLLPPPTASWHDFTWIRPYGCALCNTLRLDGKPIDLVVGGMVPGRTIRVAVSSNSRIMHSYIAERGLRTMARGDDPLPSTLNCAKRQTSSTSEWARQRRHSSCWTSTAIVPQSSNDRPTIMSATAATPFLLATF